MTKHSDECILDLNYKVELELLLKLNAFRRMGAYDHRPPVEACLLLTQLTEYVVVLNLERRVFWHLSDCVHYDSGVVVVVVVNFLLDGFNVFVQHMA